MGQREIWFEPKRYGYGAGVSVVWQGWALLIGFIAIVFAAAHYVQPHSPAAFFAIVLLLTLGLMVISARHTRGGWRWRWGGD